jgi:hypothetical protein
MFITMQPDFCKSVKTTLEHFVAEFFKQLRQVESEDTAAPP